MICVRKMAACLYMDIPHLEYCDVFQEACLAFIINSDKDLTCSLKLAVMRDVKDVFLSRKWRDVLPRGRRHIGYVIMPPNYWDRVEAASPEDEYVDKIMADQMVEQLMELLPAASRQLLTDRYWLGLTDGEIAKQEGVERSTITKRHTRIIDQLREAPL